MSNSLQFTDLNFKIAIAQVLMYDMNLLVPQFDIWQFAETYSQRPINIDDEGYDIIPEALSWFESLIIPAAFANEVTEIYQDGGNEIYMQICPFWSGESDIFNIHSTEDAMQFTNLKKVTLFYGEPSGILERFSELGISAEYL
jgi:hypothetical protein